MEIEAKFAVPNSSIARELRGVTHLGEYTLGESVTHGMRDTFYDTPFRDLQRAHYVLRVRRRDDGKYFLTVKTPTEHVGAIHRRPETEVTLQLARTPRVLMPTALPQAVRSVIHSVVEDESLRPLFSISQTRRVRVVRRQRQMIAEWSLDRVQFRAGTRRRVFYELEVELKNAGTDTDLETIAEILSHDWGLLPERKSKFARALEFMRVT